MSNKKEAVIELLKRLKETQNVEIEDQIIEICGPVIDEMYAVLYPYEETYGLELPELFDDMYDTAHSRLFELSEYNEEKGEITFEGTTDLVVNVFETSVTMPLWWLEENASTRFKTVCKEAAKEQLERKIEKAQTDLEDVKALLSKLKEEG